LENNKTKLGRILILSPSFVSPSDNVPGGPRQTPLSAHKTIVRGGGECPNYFSHGPLAEQGDVGKEPQFFRLRGLRTPPKIKKVFLKKLRQGWCQVWPVVHWR
jgi:hypothetical protein